MKNSTIPNQAYQLKKKARDVMVAKESKVKEVFLDLEDRNIKVLLGGDLDQDHEHDLTKFLKNRKSTIAWKHEDMTTISKDVKTHKHNINPSFRPTHQIKKKFSPERNLIIQEEIARLLKAKMIKEVKFPRWLANVVVFKKNNGKWRVCVDFTDLNKSCPKDPFPLPHIDSLVDATTSHEILTFMDASPKFQRIQMKP